MKMKRCTENYTVIGDKTITHSPVNAIATYHGKYKVTAKVFQHKDHNDDK